jgi:hypothetical protein
MRKSLGKNNNNNLAKLLDDLIDVRCDAMRCDGKLRIIPHSPVLPHLLVLMLQLNREVLRVELVYHHHHLSAAAEREDEMEDGACCNVELACGLFVWPVRVHVQMKREERVKFFKRIEYHSQRSNVHLSATEDEALLWRRNTRLLLNFLLDPSDL